MTYIDTWRSDLKNHLSEFAPLAKEDRSLNLIYGITASAVLWGVRDAPFNDEQKAALKEAVGADQHLPHLLRAVGGWDAMTPLEAARSLSKRQRDSDELREALTALMGTFIEDLFSENMVQTQHIGISGNITGGNIVIGGHQIVAGDLVVQYITQQKIRACPTAPKPPAHFAGRRDELDRLKDVLGQGQSVAITGIQGVGGIGKTALSLQLASEMSEFSAVLWASLGPNPTPGNQLIEWARHADPDFDPGQDDLDMLVSRVQALLTNLIQDECPGRVLVILDDIWEGDSVRAARTLQKAAPVNSVSLITTRSQQVVAQLRSTRLELQPMTPSDALQMLRNLLSDYPDIPNDILLELAEVVGYHPLAMELAAGQVTLLERPTQDIGEQIKRYRGGIPAGSPFRDIGLELGEDREDNLEVVLAFSYDSLTETEQAQFRALGVLAYNAPFDREICKAIWAVEDSKPALDSLRHRALLGIAENEGWYQQHILLRAYAMPLLKQHGEYAVAFNRYADHTIVKTEQFGQLSLEEWEQLDPLLPHVEAVGNDLSRRYAATDAPDSPMADRVGNFAYNVYLFVYYRPQMIETEGRRVLRGLNWLEAGLNAFERQEDEKRQALMLNNIGAMWDALGEKRKALGYYEQALSLRRTVGDWGGEATTLSSIGKVWSDLGEKRKALGYYEQALLLRRMVGDRGGEATTLNNIGAVWDALGEKRKALDFYEQVLPLRRAVGDRGGEATTLNNIGLVWYTLGEKRKALDFYEQALHLSEAVGDRGGEATTLNNIGGVWDDLGEQRKALDFYEQALHLSEAVGDRGGEATTLNNIGLMWSALGEPRKALDYYEQALSLLRAVGNRSVEATTLNNIGWMWDNLGKKRKALEYYEQALPLSKAVGDRGGEAGTLNHIGLMWSALGEKRKALDYYEQALPLQRAVGDRGGEAITCVNLTLMLCQLGRATDAMPHIHRAIELQPENYLNLYWRAHVRLHTGDYEQALEDFQKDLKGGDDAMTQAYGAFWVSVTYRLMQETQQAEHWLNQSADAAQHLNSYVLSRFQALRALMSEGAEAARPLYVALLSAPELKQKPFSPRFYLFQLVSLFPEREGYSELYDWFAVAIQSLYE